ncbi:MAG: RHS repeat protein [Bacilli bacterium]|nr:RHS repeat protein [Bacilli bacterium]
MEKEIKEIIKYDEKDNIIYRKKANGLEDWYRYDENSNIIYHKTSNKEYWYKYDNKNRLINMKDSNGYEESYEYDEKGNKSLIKQSIIIGDINIIKAMN